MPFDTSLLSPQFVLFCVIAFGVFWIVQFAKLMALDADSFPGQYDRYGWVAAFALLWFLSPLAFFLWNAQRPRRSARER